ncbi:MAG: hypothetical protein WC878_03150 [Candidatus Paceibacterota bacterium]|jgi:hypothetical protein
MNEEQNQQNIVSGVGFDEEKIVNYAGRPSKMVLFVVEHSRGYIKSSKQATMFLWALVALMFVLSAFFVISSSPKVPSQSRTPIVAK